MGTTTAQSVIGRGPMSDVNHSPGSAYGRPCVLCGETIDDYGHNPEPLVDWPGRCCSTCNDTKVIPGRIALMTYIRRMYGPNPSKEEE